MFNFLDRKFNKVINIAYERNWISKETLIKILNIYKYNGILTCELCKEPINNNNDNRKFSIDHIIPKTEGGDSSLKNLRVAHRKCNSDRRDSNGQNIRIFRILSLQFMWQKRI